jgi:hypothetical protein
LRKIRAFGRTKNVGIVLRIEQLLLDLKKEQTLPTNLCYLSKYSQFFCTTPRMNQKLIETGPE